MSTQDLLLFLFLRAYRVLSKAYYAKGVLSKYSFMQMRNKTIVIPGGWHSQDFLSPRYCPEQYSALIKQALDKYIKGK
jgi:hypothetical protein